MKEKITSNIKKQVESNEIERKKEGIEMREGEVVPEFSVIHNITVDVQGKKIEARQLNNRIFISDKQKDILRSISHKLGATTFNIPHDKATLLLKEKLQLHDVIVNPINIILFSSKGLVAGEKMTSFYPSEGITFRPTSNGRARVHHGSSTA